MSLKCLLCLLICVGTGEIWGCCHERTLKWSDKLAPLVVCWLACRRCQLFPEPGGIERSPADRDHVGPAGQVEGGPEPADGAQRHDVLHG